jgi:protein dithiol oxidoreductase (disulfide-forming)
MNPLRRSILLGLGSLALAPIPMLAQQKAPEAGFEYQLLSPPLPPVSPTRIEVIEFFWYGCPHCYAFEPVIEPWIKTLPGDVMFHRVPAVFHDDWAPHAQLYYTIEALRQTERLHPLIYDAIHQQGRPLANETEMTDFAAAHGVSRKRFVAAYRSAAVKNGLARGARLQEAYKIEGVPTMGIDGRYITSTTMMPDVRHESVPAVVDFLIRETRRQRGLAMSA